MLHQGRSRSSKIRINRETSNSNFASRPVHRRAAQVHECLRLGKQHRSAAHRTLAHQRHGLLAGNANAVAFRQPVRHQEAEVMRRPFVFRPRIPETDQQKLRLRHPFCQPARCLAGSPAELLLLFLLFLFHFLFHFFLGRRCLGAAAAAASTAAPPPRWLPRRRASPPRGKSTISGGLTSVIDPDSGTSPARRACPSINSVTSIRNSSGMSSGRHSISISRETISCKPPCCLTPRGSPIGCTGTFDGKPPGKIHALQIDVQKSALQGIFLPVDDHHRHRFAVQADVENRVVTRLAVQDSSGHPSGSQRWRRVPGGRRTTRRANNPGRASGAPHFSPAWREALRRLLCPSSYLPQSRQQTGTRTRPQPFPPDVSIPSCRGARRDYTKSMLIEVPSWMA